MSTEFKNEEMECICGHSGDGKCHCCGYEGKVATCSSCGEDVCLNCAEIVSDITAADSDKEKLICRFCDDDDDNNDTEYIIPAGF